MSLLTVAERDHPRAHARLTWPDRAWLALLAGTLPIGRIAAMRLIVTPGTILRWHRDINRRHWARRSRLGRSGRPPTSRMVRSVVLRLALDFFTTDLLNGTEVYVLAAIEHGTRSVRILGATEHPVQAPRMNSIMERWIGSCQREPLDRTLVWN